MTGHSLGGAVAENAGRLQDVPVIVFNAPNFDPLAAARDQNLRIRTDWDPVSGLAGASPNTDLVFSIDTISTARVPRAES